MVSMEQLKSLAKSVMNASVEAQLDGLTLVSVHLGMAFEEIVREAEKLRELEGLEELIAVAKEYEEEEVGG